MTLKLLQILCLYDNTDAIDVDKVVEYIKCLQQEDGSFAGDKWGKYSQTVPLRALFLTLILILDLKRFHAWQK